MRRGTALGWLTIALLAIAGLTLGPLPMAGLIALHRVFTVLAEAVGAAAPSRPQVEALANLLLFLPVGLAARAFFRAPPDVALIAALCTSSALIEVAQALQPARTPSVRDVVLNTAGGAVGVAFGRAYQQWRLRRDRMRAGLQRDSATSSKPEP